MQQASNDQESVSDELNPAPVSASSGQTAVTQVMTSNSHPPLGQLAQTPGQQIYRFRHDVDLQKHPKVGLIVYMFFSF